MVELVIISFILAKFCTRGAVDITSMVTGKEPPSMAYRDAKGENKEKGPLQRALSAWWSDAMEDADEMRRIRRVKARERRIARAEWVDAPLHEKLGTWWTAGQKKASQQKAEREAERQQVIDSARPKPEEVPVSQPPVPRDFIPPVEETDPHGRSRPNSWTDPDYQPWTKPIPQTPLPEAYTDEDFADRVAEPRIGPAIDPTPTPVDVAPSFPDGPQLEDFAPEPPAEPAPATVPDDGEWHPINPGPRLTLAVDNTKEEGNKMSDDYKNATSHAETAQAPAGSGVNIVGERPVETVHSKGQEGGMRVGSSGGSGSSAPVAAPSGTGTIGVEGGIGTHIRWTGAAAQYQIQASATVENVAAQMAGAQNGPAVLALAAQIQEAHTLLKARYDALNAILVQHRNTVGEAYRSTGNQAGTKGYVTGE